MSVYGLQEINQFYGNPDANRDFILDPEFQRKYLIKKALPYALRLPWGNQVSRNIYGHVLAVPKIIEFFIMVADSYGGYSNLRSAGLDIWAGCFQFRTKASGTGLSTHSWGIAFDYLPQLGPYNQESRIPFQILNIATELGFENGSHWTIPDGMHFQLCSGY